MQFPHLFSRNPFFQIHPNVLESKNIKKINLISHKWTIMMLFILLEKRVFQALNLNLKSTFILEKKISKSCFPMQSERENLRFFFLILNKYKCKYKYAAIRDFL